MSGDASTKARAFLLYVFLIVSLVIFSLLRNANVYLVTLFDATLGLYAFVWTIVLVLFLYLQYLLAAKHGFSWLTIYLGFFLLGFGALQDFFLQKLHSPFLASTWTLVALFVLIYIAVTFLFKGGAFMYSKRFYFLLALFGALSLFEVGKVLFTARPAPFKVTHPSLAPTAKNEKAPDIYFIIFDSYTSNALLQQNWGFNNDSIEAFLKEHHFSFSDNATSSYDFTPLSINSTLNLNVLDIPKGLQHDFINFNYGRKVFDTAFVPRWLQQQGYQTSAYSMLSANYRLDDFFPFTPDEPLHWLRRKTIERIWLTPSLWNRLRSILGQEQKLPAIDALRNFNHLIRDSLLAKRTGSHPAFVYAHFHLPHEPYVFNQDGTSRPDPEVMPEKEEDNKRLYIEHVKYANQLIRQIVTTLFNDGNKNKVIIIQGDHGYRQYPLHLQHHKLGILNAVYFPDGDYSQLSGNFRAVNTFRVVLNKYFNQRLALIK